MAERALTRQKALGAYYTDPRVCNFLAAWGLRTSPGRVLDPSCGDGRFLAAALRHGAQDVIGVDLDPNALQVCALELESLDCIGELYESDFFLLEPEQLPPVDLLLGNPPFIRYQQFRGDSRARALASALRVGARLSKLSASWAPFLLHAVQFLRPGGAMGMVAPAEIAQTTYGVETLRALCGNFARVRLINFRHNWFEGAQQEAVLVLAEEHGGQCAEAELVPLDGIDALGSLELDAPSAPGLSFEPTRSGALGLALLGPQVRALLGELDERYQIRRLRDLGTVANGYVSGANSFFHATRTQAAERGIPPSWLRAVARNSRSLRGLAFSAEDVDAAERGGAAHHLVLPDADDPGPSSRAALERLISEGEREEIPERYKCRVREPWWRVPGLIEPDVLLPYMIGQEPHGSVNRCRAHYTNSLHGLRMNDPALADRVVLGLLSSLSLLSMELHGRSYGGGVLKLEPTEMQQVLVALPQGAAQRLGAELGVADGLLRSGRFEEAVELADRLVLTETLQLGAQQIETLRQARGTLLERRLTRGRGRKRA